MLRAFESLGDMRGRCTTREPRKSRLYASCGVPFGVVCPIKDLPQALEGLLSTHKRVGGLATAWAPALPERGLPGMRFPGPELPGTRDGGQQRQVAGGRLLGSFGGSKPLALPTTVDMSTVAGSLDVVSVRAAAAEAAGLATVGAPTISVPLTCYAANSLRRCLLSSHARN